jgi:hypothetical protein
MPDEIKPGDVVQLKMANSQRRSIVRQLWLHGDPYQHLKVDLRGLIK